MGRYHEQERKDRVMGLAEVKKQQKRLDLMDAAFQLFTTQGIAKTSIEEIVKRAGVAKGTFYLYFKDKYDIHQRLIQRHAEQLFRHSVEYSGYRERQSSAEKVLALTDDILRQLQENRWLLRFVGRNLTWNVLCRAFVSSETDYRPVLEDIFGPGMLDDKDLRIELFTILELIGSTCQSVILENDPVELETYLPYLHRSILAIMNSFAFAPEVQSSPAFCAR